MQKIIPLKIKSKIIPNKEQKEKHTKQRKRNIKEKKRKRGDKQHSRIIPTGQRTLKQRTEQNRKTEQNITKKANGRLLSERP